MSSNKLTEYILVLDLDSTLIHTMDHIEDYQSLKIQSKNRHLRERVYDFELCNKESTEKLWGVYRPHLKEFIDFAVNYFAEIRIWSAGKYMYVHNIVDLIFGVDHAIPSSIKSYHDCVFTKTNVRKPLSNYGDQLDKIIAIDDRSDTFGLNKDNGIKIPIYEPNPTEKAIMAGDDSLIKIMKWFMKEEIIRGKDIRLFDKSKIFG